MFWIMAVAPAYWLLPLPKLGAAHVIGVDIDPQAVAASRGNALLNHCETKVEFHTAHFGAQADTPREPRMWSMSLWPTSLRIP